MELRLQKDLLESLRDFLTMYRRLSRRHLVRNETKSFDKIPSFCKTPFAVAN